ncbi:carbohydrate ABC transporter permease [Pseudonocardia nigra]|uniref:carbohydrate ABC transporter permease n=1 Tax=Pseudonocardia nigra TaxID=1921578 RepID=UPI001C5E371F|nr:carbohydrate ABC transporter permease [Pseudonocardia nigra]
MTTVAAPPRRSGADRRRSLLWHASAILLLVVLLYPLAWLLLGTFKPTNRIIGDVNIWPEEFVGFENYASALEGVAGIPVVRFFGNSLLLAIASVVGTVASSALAAYAFARLRFRGDKVLFGFMISTLLLPFHVLIIPQYIIFQRLELVDTYAPLLLPKFLATEAFFVFLMVQFIRGLPRDLDEAATIDGCGHLRTFWHVIVPLMRPALITSGLFAFIWSWNDFLAPLIYITSPDKYPLPLALQFFVDQTSTSDYGALVALSLLALLPVVLFFLAFQRYLVEGVATQGLKG